ncbi:unnamed protein product [Lepeophtheirus salmonis]|uniref:(salmon louse) hypothetical protein n=1 Tax=Lepeophtheirus salmonis TaxID=72036 RepID=A0A7R8CRC1_LEPSM|nr:unnamed protein product [Lepeophtheirus salmonis]CAF2869366.1 unnamed protein product [Lepeophtheirus salmonis]
MIQSVLLFTLKEACFSDHHCESLPNTACKSDYEIPRYNHSCQCLLGHKPFNPDPKTGLIEGCSILTEKEKLTIHGCLERFRVDTAYRVPKKVTDFVYDHDEEAYIASVQIKFQVDPFSPNSKNLKGYSDVAVIKLLNKYKSGDKMLSVSFDRSDGRITIDDTLRSRGFFFENDYTREKTGVEDIKTLQLMEKEFVGFWIMYSYKKGFGGTMSVGLNGVPINIENSLVSWTDTSDSVLEKPVYIAFTTENEGSTVDFGSTCVIKKNPTVPPPSRRDGGYSLVARVNSPLINPWISHGSRFVKEEGSINNWQLNSGPYSDSLMHQQYLDKLSKILPQYYEDDKNTSRSILI